MFILRPAQEGDQGDIRGLIRRAQINPIGLDWQRFLVAMTPEEELAGCGQVKPHGDGSKELASIAVQPEWQRQGIASAIVWRLIAEHPGPLYLTCRSGLETFYQRFGFRSLQVEEMPAYFRRISKLAGLLKTLCAVGEELLVMKRD